MSSDGRLGQIAVLLKRPPLFAAIRAILVEGCYQPMPINLRVLPNSRTLPKVDNIFPKFHRITLISHVHFDCPIIRCLRIQKKFSFIILILVCLSVKGAKDFDILIARLLFVPIATGLPTSTLLADFYVKSFLQPHKIKELLARTEIACSDTSLLVIVVYMM